MQRYSNGLAVPKIMTENFTGKSTNSYGRIELELTYEPKSINDIIVNLARTSIGLVNRFVKLYSLSGKTLTIQIFAIRYQKTDYVTQGANSGGAGSDPHTHQVQFSYAIADVVAQTNEAQDAITVSYKVA